MMIWWWDHENVTWQRHTYIASLATYWRYDKSIHTGRNVNNTRNYHKVVTFLDLACWWHAEIDDESLSQESGRRISGYCIWQIWSQAWCEWQSHRYGETEQVGYTIQGSHQVPNFWNFMKVSGNKDTLTLSLTTSYQDLRESLLLEGFLKAISLNLSQPSNSVLEWSPRNRKVGFANPMLAHYSCHSSEHVSIRPT